MEATTSEERAADGTTPAEYWGARAAAYDDFIRRVVPGYEEQLEQLFAYMPARAERVLELGCGTGNVSLRLAVRWPAAHFTFVDAAPEMLEVTRARLAAAHPAAAARATFVSAHFEEFAPEATSHDLIIASLSLHHVRDVAEVYPRLAPALQPGGRFLMLDGLRGVPDAVHEVHMARWAAYWPGRLSATEIEDVTGHIAQHDHYRTLAEHTALLTRAGFTDIDCVWRDGLFTLVTASGGGGEWGNG